MLLNLDPLLTGDLLQALDAMGHSDAIVVADAHFPAARIAHRPVIDLPMVGTPRVLRAISSVVPPDEYGGAFGLDLMESPEPGLLDVQAELVAAAGLTPDRAQLVDRFAFYDLAKEAFVIVRTGETRIYGNALLRKGIIPAATHG